VFGWWGCRIARDDSVGGFSFGRFGRKERYPLVGPSRGRFVEVHARRGFRVGMTRIVKRGRGVDDVVGGVEGELEIHFVSSFVSRMVDIVVGVFDGKVSVGIPADRFRATNLVIRCLSLRILDGFTPLGLGGITFLPLADSSGSSSSA